GCARSTRLTSAFGSSSGTRSVRRRRRGSAAQPAKSRKRLRVNERVNDSGTSGELKGRCKNNSQARGGQLEYPRETQRPRCPIHGDHSIDAELDLGGLRASKRLSRRVVRGRVHHAEG